VADEIDLSAEAVDQGEGVGGEGVEVVGTDDRRRGVAAQPWRKDAVGLGEVLEERDGGRRVIGEAVEEEKRARVDRAADERVNVPSGSEKLVRVNLSCGVFIDQISVAKVYQIHTGSPDLHHDLPFGPAFFEIRKRLLRLIERKHLVNYRSDAPRFEEFANLCELPTIWMHEQE
jgi:hypothetical protein